MIFGQLLSLFDLLKIPVSGAHVKAISQLDVMYMNKFKYLGQLPGIIQQ
ncbi:MAG: hypothetical protein IPJ40_17335 [Saprospirales bacterium]|nr:hypothetical protein [Saprospirales bacterium]